jgi:hypothetical protein
LAAWQFPLGKVEEADMRACFLGQTVCALGYGVAIIQMPPVEPLSQGTPPGNPSVEADKPHRAEKPMQNLMVRRSNSILIS